MINEIKHIVNSYHPVKIVCLMYNIVYKK